MAPPNATRPAPALTGNGPLEDGSAGKTIFPRNSKSPARPQGNGPDLEWLVDLARWKQELAAKLRRAEMCFELTSCDIDLDALQDEVALWHRTSLAVQWRGRR